MNNILKSFVILVTTLAIAACQNADSQSTDPIDTIEEALRANDTDLAQQLCDKILSQKSAIDSLSTPQLCRMAINMARLADHEPLRDENTAQAVLLYCTALSRDSAATTAYIRTLETDDYAHVYLLNQLARPIADREDGIIYTPDEDETDQ